MTVHLSDDGVFLPQGGGHVEVVEQRVNLRLEVALPGIIVGNIVIGALSLTLDAYGLARGAGDEEEHREQR